MSIIAKENTPCIGSISMRVGEHGLHVKLSKGGGLPSHLEGVKRGKISGFSSGAVRRLREALFCKYIPNATCLGATYTVPWKVKECTDEVLTRFASTFKRFRMRFVRSFPRSAIIYRVELQTRGAPHLHCVCYLDREDETSALGEAQRAAMPDVARVAFAKMRLQNLWLSALDYDDMRQVYGASRHAVDFDDLTADDCSALFKYLCDHTSKKKQAQLGYKGKQWGILGRDNLCDESSIELPAFPSLHSEGVFWRYIRKLTRYRISDETRTKKWKRAPVFGCVYRGGNRRRGVIFVRGGGDIVRRCFEIAIAQDHQFIEKTAEAVTPQR